MAKKEKLVITLREELDLIDNVEIIYPPNGLPDFSAHGCQYTLDENGKRYPHRQEESIYDEDR